MHIHVDCASGVGEVWVRVLGLLMMGMCDRGSWPWQRRAYWPPGPDAGQEEAGTLLLKTEGRRCVDRNPH